MKEHSISVMIIILSIRRFYYLYAPTLSYEHLAYTRHQLYHAHLPIKQTITLQ